MSEQTTKVTVATVWLDGCSACHMSLIDMDERLIELTQYIDIVYSPLVDTKEYPAMVDVAIVEGAVSSGEDLEKIKKIRAHSKILIALGDCAVAGNIPEDLHHQRPIVTAIVRRIQHQQRAVDALRQCKPSVRHRLVHDGALPISLFDCATSSSRSSRSASA